MPALRTEWIDNSIRKWCWLAIHAVTMHSVWNDGGYCLVYQRSTTLNTPEGFRDIDHFSAHVRHFRRLVVRLKTNAFSLLRCCISSVRSIPCFFCSTRKVIDACPALASRNASATPILVLVGLQCSPIDMSNKEISLLPYSEWQLLDQSFLGAPAVRSMLCVEWTKRES